jgi:ArsR family transcriptional regulator
MEQRYLAYADMFKALSDGNRLMIVEMLAGGELCACRILEKLNITQPTLSHHMRILCESGLVNGRKEGKWMYYSLAKTKMAELQDVLCLITLEIDKCGCIEKIV